MVSSASSAPAAAPSSPPSADPGASPVRWMLLFSFFNGINFTIALGAPMVLTAKFLGAGDSLIGTIMSFTPFMVILQLLVSNLAERWGYKRLVLAGWGTRSFMIMLAIPLPLLHGVLPPAVLLGVLTVLLLGFNVIRGFTCIGWLPWISQVIPEGERGRYFGRDQTVVNIGILLTLFCSGQFIHFAEGAWKYSALFAVSWLAGVCSVRFLTRVPVSVPGVPRPAVKPQRSWRELLAAYRRVWNCTPFRRVTLFSCCNSLAFAAFGGFLVVFLKDDLRVREGDILMLAACGTLGTFLTAIPWGRFADRYGSRPTLRLAGIGQMLILVVWLAIAARFVAVPGFSGIACLFLLFGVTGAAIAIPQTKLVLAFCPEEEVTVGITLNGVVTSFCAGVAPVLWGVLLEKLLPGWLSGAGPWRPYAVFFTASLLLALVGQVVLKRIREPAAMPTVKVMITLFRDWPLRVISDIGWFTPRTPESGR